MSDGTELTGRGGPGRGQGALPLYGKVMPKKQVRLHPDMLTYLKAAGDSAKKLRGLLEWAADNEDALLPDPGRSALVSRTSFAMTDGHWALAERLGEGSRVAGIRRVVHTAMETVVEVKAS